MTVFRRPSPAVHAKRRGRPPPSSTPDLRAHHCPACPLDVVSRRARRRPAGAAGAPARSGAAGYLGLLTCCCWPPASASPRSAPGLHALDVRALVLLHVSRFLGGYFLLLYQPRRAALRVRVPGGWGDIIVALLALAWSSCPCARSLRRHAYHLEYVRPGRPLLVAPRPSGSASPIRGSSARSRSCPSACCRPSSCRCLSRPT